MSNFKDLKHKDVFIILIVLLITVSYFLDKILINYDGNIFDFYDLESLVFFSKMKILIILISLVWYFTCHHWWKSSILIIITIELLKLMSIFNPNQLTVDKIEFITSLPITIPIVFLLLFISKKLSNYNLAKELSFYIDNEIDDIFFELYKNKSNEITNLNERLNRLRKNKHKEGNLKYLEELISLRDEFYNTK
ncbi:MAG: hypothetical protein KDC67_10565 [Ignavibacteriae bacterium]|nr:hypothetical protein [Ignavibacteriota bacterium]